MPGSPTPCSSTRSSSRCRPASPGVAIALVLIQLRAGDAVDAARACGRCWWASACSPPCRSLPRTVALAGAWYVAAGVVVLALSSQTQTLSPWTMGLPFVIGQLLLAAILHFAFGDIDDEVAG